MAPDSAVSSQRSGNGDCTSVASAVDGEPSGQLGVHSSERRREENEDYPAKPRACLGALYFNQKRYDAQKPPLCGGFRRKLQEDRAGQLPTDSVPGGDFKYLCFGYSAYDEEGLKRTAARRSSEADAVVLPYCEGLEVISATALSRKPELMSAGGPDVNQPAPSTSGGGGSQDPRPMRQRPGRSFVPRAPEMPEGMTFEQFKERFERMAGRMVDKMQSNGAFMVTHIKRTWQQVARELGVGGGGDRGRRDQ